MPTLSWLRVELRAPGCGPTGRIAEASVWQPAPNLAGMSEVVNRYEFEAVGPRGKLVALTLGAEGAMLLEHGEEVTRARPPRVEAVDGTAAGDAFCAALVVSLLEGRERGAALARACAAGALAASRVGAQPSLPTAAELDAVLAA
jgi:ribokinase